MFIMFYFIETVKTVDLKCDTSSSSLQKYKLIMCRSKKSLQRDVRHDVGVDCVFIFPADSAERWSVSTALCFPVCCHRSETPHTHTSIRNVHVCISRYVLYTHAVLTSTVSISDTTSFTLRPVNQSQNGGQEALHPGSWSPGSLL